MFDIALSSLAAELIRDLQRPEALWQVLALVLIFAVAKLAERGVRHNDPQVAQMGTAVRLGHRSLKRLTFPLLSLVLVLIVRELLRPHMHVNLLSLSIPLLGSMAMIRFVFFVLRVTFSHSLWLNNFERAFSSIVWCVVALHITGFLPALIDFLEAVHIPAGKQQLSVWTILQGTLLVAAALLVSLWLGALIDSRLALARGLDSNLQVVFSRLAKAILVVVAIMIALPAVGIDLTALSVFGGALGVGLGLGLQKIASNYIAGFIILLERSIRIGNTIAVGADKGRVTKITTRYTVLRAGSGIEALVPNEALVGGTVQNETYSDTWVRYSLQVQVGYQDDVPQALALLQSIAKAHAGVAEFPEPQAFVVLFADSGINLELWFWLADPDASQQRIRSDLHLTILKAFNEAGISIPFPQREIRVLEGAGAASSVESVTPPST